MRTRKGPRLPGHVPSRRRPLTAGQRAETAAVGGTATWDKPTAERDQVRAAISEGMRRKWVEWKAAGFKRDDAFKAKVSAKMRLVWAERKALKARKGLSKVDAA